MPRLQSNVNYADGPGGTALVTTAETVIATLPGISTPGPDGRVILEAASSVTTGTAATAIILRIRRGTTTGGALVGGTGQIQLAAGLNAVVSVRADDNPGEVAGQQYVLTAQQVAATGNGAVPWANLQATY